MTVHDLRAELGDSRERMLAAITGLAEEQFRYTPTGGDGWCIAAHLAHLLRIERVYAERACARAA